MSHVDALAPGTHLITVDGVRQRYHVYGAGPVCVIHSGGPGIAWEYLRMPAVEAHLTCVYVEPVGTGESGRLADHPRGYAVDRYAHFVHRLIEHLGLPRVHLLGHSHGGFVAQRYALAHPDRLAGLILYDSAPAAGAELMAEAARNLDEFARRHAGQPEVQSVLQAWKAVPSIADDESCTAIIRQLLPAYFADYWSHEHELAPLRAAMRAVNVSSGTAPFDNLDALGSITTPTLVIVGKYDFICGLRWARRLHDGIPGSELVVLDSSGHFGHLEEPDNFAHAVASFVG